MIPQKIAWLTGISLNLCLMACSTTQNIAPNPTAADFELKQDYNAKSRDLNKKLRAEWMEIQSLSVKACEAPAATSVIDRTKTIEILKSCVVGHSWLMAERWAQLLMEGDVNSPWGPYFMSLIAEGRSQLARAQWMIDLAISRAPQIEGMSYQKARLFWKADSPREALAWATRATELDPDFAQAHFMIGHIHYRDHEWKEASTAFQKARVAGMKDSSLSFESAECALMDHDKVAALQNYQDALKLGSRYIGLKEKIAALQKEEAQAQAAAQAKIQSQTQAQPQIQSSGQAPSRSAASDLASPSSLPVEKNK